jgi:uncharacterized protein YgfB (UPF0149 family)
VLMAKVRNLINIAQVGIDPEQKAAELESELEETDAAIARTRW